MIGRKDTADSEQAADSHMEVRTSVVNRRNQAARENKKEENTTGHRREAPESDTESLGTNRTREMTKEEREKEKVKEKEEEKGAIVEEEDIAQEEAVNREVTERKAAATETQTNSSSYKIKAARVFFPENRPSQNLEDRDNFPENYCQLNGVKLGLQVNIG